MTTRTKLISLAVLVLAALLLLRYLARDKASVPASSLKAIQAIPLKPHETARVQIKDDTLITLTRAGIKSRYIPPESTLRVTVTDAGNVDEEIRDHGFTFEPAIGLLYSDRPRLAIDAEFYYWNRLGLNCGLGFSNHRDIVSPYIALSYQLDQLHLDNTSLLFGYTLQKDVLIGVRISF